MGGCWNGSRDYWIALTERYAVATLGCISLWQKESHITLKDKGWEGDSKSRGWRGLFTDMHPQPHSISISGFLQIADPDLTLSNYSTILTFILKSGKLHFSIFNFLFFGSVLATWNRVALLYWFLSWFCSLAFFPCLLHFCAQSGWKVAIFTVTRIEEIGVTPDNLTVGGFSMVSIASLRHFILLQLFSSWPS